MVISVVVVSVAEDDTALEGPGDVGVVLAPDCVLGDGPATAQPVIITANDATKAPTATLRLAIRAQRSRPRSKAINAMSIPTTPIKINNPGT